MASGVISIGGYVDTTKRGADTYLRCPSCAHYSRVAPACLPSGYEHDASPAWHVCACTEADLDRLANLLPACGCTAQIRLRRSSTAGRFLIADARALPAPVVRAQPAEPARPGMTPNSATPDPTSARALTTMYLKGAEMLSRPSPADTPQIDTPQIDTTTLSGVLSRYTISCAHHLPRHRGKCQYPHGHNYSVEVSASGPVDRDTGMVMDFEDLDTAAKKVLAEFDHRNLNDFFENPTAERLAAYLLDAIPQASTVTVWETPTHAAYATRVLTPGVY